MQCPKCHATIRDDSLFCTQCGAKIVSKGAASNTNHEPSGSGQGGYAGSGQNGYAGSGQNGYTGSGQGGHAGSGQNGYTGSGQNSYTGSSQNSPRSPKKNDSPMKKVARSAALLAIFVISFALGVGGTRVLYHKFQEEPETEQTDSGSVEGQSAPAAEEQVGQMHSSVPVNPGTAMALDLPDEAAIIPEAPATQEPAATSAPTQELTATEATAQEPTATEAPESAPTSAQTQTSEAAATPASAPTAEPVDTEQELHTYRIYMENISWEDAYRKCIEKGGYLCRINSEEEFQTIVKLLESDSVYQKACILIGGRRDMDSNDYHWVDANNSLMQEVLNGPGTAVSSHWVPGQPTYSDQGVTEHVLDLLRYNGVWGLNDIPNDILASNPSFASYFSGKIGYICEYEE